MPSAELWGRSIAFWRDRARARDLHVIEPTGACSRSLTGLLRATSKSIGLPGIHDSTVYGTSRASPRSYFGHHLAAISASVVVSDANTLVNHGAALNLTLTIPSLVPNVRAGSSGARHA